MEYQIYDSFFNHQVQAMFFGIESTMAKKESFYTCALALSTYTEVMGGLVTGKLKEEKNSRKNYHAFLHYLGQKYVELNDTLTKQKLSLHKIVRSKLVHEFALRHSHFIINAEEPLPDRIGIEIGFFEDKIVHVNIWIKEYYRDFKKGVEKYHEDLSISVKCPPFSQGHILFDNCMNSIIDRSLVEDAMNHNKS